MALELIGAASTTAFTTTPVAVAQWAQWSKSTVPWATAGKGFIRLKPGRYRVESPDGVTVELTNPSESQGDLSADVLVEHETREMQIYIRSAKAGTVFITRLV